MTPYDLYDFLTNWRWDGGENTNLFFLSCSKIELKGYPVQFGRFVWCLGKNISLR